MLYDVECFLAATSLTGEELTELLYGDPDLERLPIGHLRAPGHPWSRSPSTAAPCKAARRE